ncbi:MAG: hypothetical protein H6623_07955 [Bdellovibrionaceae bacterium]|nr:hypothetical protein [Pseudobdellovibrionaceae bacterium]
MRLLSLIYFLFSLSTAQAGVVYDQMQNDLVQLQEEIQSSITQANEYEDKIVEKYQSGNAGDDLLGYTIVKSSSRVLAFRLQGVLRLLNKSDDFKKKQGDKIHDLYSDMKTIEDVIGKMDEVLTTLKRAIEKGAPESKLAKLRAQVDAQSKRVVEDIDSVHFFKQGGAERALEKIDFLEELHGKSEIHLVNGAIDGEIEYFQSKITEELIPGFKAEEFSHESMENYFHEFRREIRWIAIYFNSLPSIYSLTPYKTDGYTVEEQALLEEYKDSKYAQINSENSPVIIERVLFYKLTAYIEKAGDAKDAAEEHFKLEEAGIPNDLDETQFKKDMIQIMKQFLDDNIFEKFQDIVNQY